MAEEALVLGVLASELGVLALALGLKPCHRHRHRRHHHCRRQLIVREARPREHFQVKENSGNSTSALYGLREALMLERQGVLLWIFAWIVSRVSRKS